MLSTKFRKTVAMFFLLLMAQSVIAPCVSYALTAGPTAPEFSSFEPVDTTDMVNLATGELVYNTPILEVPGPEGGYPLSLSYHAGIKPDQEASWVGLGWTLNPGAISRSVNGYADDNLDSKREVRDYWGGGEQSTKAYTLGITIPNTGVGINYSVAKTRDTFKGFSVKNKVGMSINVLDPVNVVMAVGTSLLPQGSPTTKNLAKTTNMMTRLTGESSMGISLSSEGIQGHVNVFGMDLGTKNNRGGNMTSYTNETHRGTLPIGNFGSFSIKEFYTRYWSDETQSLKTFGSLYPHAANSKIMADYYTPDGELISHAFDMYDVFDDQPLPSPVQLPANDPNDAAQQLGGSLPAYDRYDVLGQGVGGIIQPHIFENGDLHGQNFYYRDPRNGSPKTDYPLTAYKSMRKFSNRKVDFRFLNEFSNALTISTPQFQVDGEGYKVNMQGVYADPRGFTDNSSRQKLAGSRHVEWFTNQQIALGTAQGSGFVDCYNDRRDRRLDFDVYENYLQPEAGLPYREYYTYGRGHGTFKDDTYGGDPYADVGIYGEFHSLKPKKANLSEKIGGFMITNETGVTYHYALPVYAYNEYVKSKLKKPRKGVSTFREYKNDEPYAYTWLLTAITGPDYVDTNNNGKLDDGDWGYWVKFDYGRWADSYQWRTPHSGFVNDMESEYSTFSYGIKELYYLDAIETRTHKAVFIKSKRKDGRGVTSRLEGGSNPRRYTMDYKGHGSLQFSVSPVSTMKLDAIYLFNKTDFDALAISKASGHKYNEATTDSPHAYGYDNYPNGGDYEFTVPFSNPVRKVTIREGEDYVFVKYHNGDLVYDDGDIVSSRDFRKKALRIIEFNTDYSLCKQVPNSIGYYSDFSSACSDQSCLDIYKKNIGSEFEWPTNFGSNSSKVCVDPFYSAAGSPKCCNDRETFYSKAGVFKIYGNFGSCPEASSLYAGDRIAYYKTGKLTLKGIKFLGRGGADLWPPTAFAYGENPDYDKDKVDTWGYYKSDRQVSGLAEPFKSSLTREITTESSAHTDAWSLQSITSPLGAKIDILYEPNQYRKSVYNDFSIFGIWSVTAGANPNEVVVGFNEWGLELSQWFTAGNPVDIKVHAVAVLPPPNVGDLTYHSVADRSYLGSTSDVITAVNSSSIIVNSPGLRSAISNGDGFKTYVVGGFIKVDDPNAYTAGSPVKYAGGIRVRSLSMTESDLQKNSTAYEYTVPVQNVSSGVTAYKPYIYPGLQYPVGVAEFDAILTEDDEFWVKRKLDQFRANFQQYVNEPLKPLLAFSREAPAPGVIYEFVRERSFVNGQETDIYAEYKFKVFDAPMITKEFALNEDGATDKRILTIKNHSSDVGSLLQSTSFNRQNSSPVHRVQYDFLYDENDEAFETNTRNSMQGVVEQSFHKHVEFSHYLFLVTESIYSKEKTLITKRQDRSNVVTGVRETNYLKDQVTSIQNHAFDFYSGQALETLTQDSYGNRYLTKTIPAYVKYPDMGLKIHDVHNKNMLTQSTARYSMLLDNNNVMKGLLSATVETWSNKVPVLGQEGTPFNIYRKHASFVWSSQQELNVDGTFSYPEFSSHPFNWTASESPHWEKAAESTLYNVYSSNLEAKDINGNFAATQMDFEQKQVMASASNASYYEIAYSGAENSIELAESTGGVSKGAGSRTAERAHSGNYSLLVQSGGTGFTHLLISNKSDLAKKYRASVWVYVPGNSETQPELDKIELYYSSNGLEKKVHPVLQKSKSKSWYLMNIDIDPAGASEVLIGVRNNSVRGVYFDDFRVHPLNASMTSYVYDAATGELTYVLDSRNLYTRFEYDAMGRLVRTSKELLNFDFGDGKESFRADAVLKEVKYNYKKP